MNDTKLPTEFEFEGPVLAEKTTFLELTKAGATSLDDIPLADLLRYVRNGLEACATEPGMQLHPDDKRMADQFGVAQARVEEAILALIHA